MRRHVALFGLSALVALLGACTTASRGGDAFAELRATVVREAADRPALQSSLLERLSAAESLFAKQDANAADHMLAEFGKRVWEARGEGLSDEAVVRIFRAADVSAEILFNRGWLNHYWSRSQYFKNRTCSPRGCDVASETHDCVMIISCGVYYGCVPYRR